MPSATRPQRPERWLADACEIGSMGSRCTLVALENRRDAGGARVDHVPDARHGQRRLGDVGGQDDAPVLVPLEHAVLLGGGQPAVEREQLDGAREPRVGDARAERAPQRVLGVADLPLAREEHEDVAGPLGA